MVPDARIPGELAPRAGGRGGPNQNRGHGRKVAEFFPIDTTPSSVRGRLYSLEKIPLPLPSAPGLWTCFAVYSRLDALEKLRNTYSDPPSGILVQLFPYCWADSTPTRCCCDILISIIAPGGAFERCRLFRQLAAAGRWTVTFSPISRLIKSTPTSNGPV